MLLTKFQFAENENTPNYWKVTDLDLEKINLIVGLNATGKTRTMNVLNIFCSQARGERAKLCNGSWEFSFKKKKEDKVFLYKYSAVIKNQEVQKEQFIIDENIVLDRQLDKGWIVDNEGQRKDYDPPSDKLTLQVRRDKKDYPYLEDLFYWAQNYYNFKLNKARSDHLIADHFAIDDKNRLESFSSIPRLLGSIISEKNIKEEIIKDMEAIGYPIKDITAKNFPFTPVPSTALSLTEKGLLCETEQMSISTGMYRALGIIIVLHYLRHNYSADKNVWCTFAADDVGEGLDFSRSSKLVKLILKRTEDYPIQVILTSNDSHLLNSISVEYWNILTRKGHVVKSINYYNSKESFDEFMMLGLNNFELLSGEMYKSRKTEDLHKEEIL